MNQKKVDINVFYTIVSFLVMGICGVLINTFIVKYYNAQVLGKFNFILTLLIITAQISVAGIHFSVLKYNTHFQSNKKLSASVVTSGLLLVTICSCIVIFLLYYFSDFIVSHFNVKDLKPSFLSMLPSIWFFSLNKVLLLSLNGLNNIKGYAILNGSRYILLFLSVIFFYIFSISVKYIGAIFVISEFVLFAIGLIYFFNFIGHFSMPNIEWMKKHISFGLRGMWGGTLLELNTKVDLLMIGYFLNDKAIGIYSFATMIVDGYSMLYYVLRNNIDPIVGNAFFHKKKDVIIKTISRFRKRYVPFLLLIGVLIIIAYPLIFGKIFHVNSSIVNESYKIVILLLCFNFFAAFFQPFIGFVNLAGKPEYFSLVILVTLFLNFLLNYFFIPLLGLAGAAVATGLVFMLQSVVLYFLGKMFIFKGIRDKKI